VACITALLADPISFRKLQYLGFQAIYMPATVTHITQHHHIFSSPLLANTADRGRTQLYRIVHCADAGHVTDRSHARIAKPCYALAASRVTLSFLNFMPCHGQQKSKCKECGVAFFCSVPPPGRD
jgi:hypothetical protein